jgi:hypothetical protein
MNTTSKVVVTFCLAGLLSACAFSSYSAWVSSRYEANYDRQRQGSNPLSHSYDQVAADRAWYKENIALTKYADRQWWILCLGFPVAMSMAMLIATLLGWLPRVGSSRVFGAHVLLYLAPSIVLFFSAISRFILLLPSLVAAAFLLRWSAEIFSARRPRNFVWALLISGTVISLLCLVLASLPRSGIGNRLPQTFFVVSLEVACAGLYGRALTSSTTSAVEPKAKSVGVRGG